MNKLTSERIELTNEEDSQLFDLLQNYLNNCSAKDRRLIKAEITVLISSAMKRAVRHALEQVGEGEEKLPIEPIT